jgi:hypothetical protein
MAEADLPDAVVELIDRYVGGIDDLELLLLLRRTGSAWTSDDAGRALATSPGPLQRTLLELAAAGLVVAAGEGFRYEPASAADRDAVDELARAYTERPVRVIGRIFSKTDRHLQDFSDAFRLWRKK